ncbi:hypothetical protein BB559_000154 [Furculomyces boomerangus]|uniref:Uncharacterized protein n=1 Tax=Furculomyces boomerangus TaxID=61424 RepID=A0A2T9Y865_9FUNG|nr:hypothetical protein BB559_005545 [Furculomyces boomerangus]PVV00070.1 hypothetical protein BB559_000154 [Furculomyces boomerangus]
MKTTLASIIVTLIQAVYSKENEISGSIYRTGLIGKRIKLKIKQDGIIITQGWHTPQKVDLSCTNNCTFQIVYNCNQTIRFNLDSVSYVHDGINYDIGYSSNKFIPERRTDIEDCDNFMLPFEAKLIKPTSK